MSNLKTYRDFLEYFSNGITADSVETETMEYVSPSPGHIPLIAWNPVPTLIGSAFSLVVDKQLFQDYEDKDKDNKDDNEDKDNEDKGELKIEDKAVCYPHFLNL